EPGKRVPGSAASGVAWAEPPERRSPGTAAHALGAALTLVGGALALLPPLGPLAWRGAAAGPALLLALTLAAICWGTYAVYVAPELALAAPPAAAAVAIPRLAGRDARAGLAGSLAGAAVFAALAAVGGRLPAWAAAVAAYPALLAAPIAWVVVRVARTARD